MSRFALFLGCYIPMRLPQVEAASRAALGNLGIELEDLDGFSCCPEPWNFKGTDLAAWLKAAGRNLAVAEKEGLDILTLCNGCSATLIEAAHLLTDGDGRGAEAAGELEKAGYPYRGKTRAFHAVCYLDGELGREEVEKSCKRRLSGLRAAVHYGCHLLRPSDVLGVDDPFHPTFLDGLVEATGAESVEYEDKAACCGKAVLNRDISRRMALDKLEKAVEAGANCLVVTCPACFDQFELVQVGKRSKGKGKTLPVLHYFQLLALAQGEDPAKLGFSRQRIKVDALLEAVMK